MAKTIQVEYEGEKVPAERIDFKVQSEPWSIYELEDGTVLRLKNVLGHVARITGKYKSDGDPIYVFGATGVAVTEVPDELKKKD